MVWEAFLEQVTTELLSEGRGRKTTRIPSIEKASAKAQRQEFA